MPWHVWWKYKNDRHGESSVWLQRWKSHRAQVSCRCTISPDAVREQLMEVPWNLFQLDAVTWSERTNKYCVSIVSLVSASPQIVSLFLFMDTGLSVPEINRPGPNREILSFKKYNVPTWEFWQKRDIEGKINTRAKLEFCFFFFFYRGC